MLGHVEAEFEDEEATVGAIIRGESLEIWFSNIRELRAAIFVWETAIGRSGNSADALVKRDSASIMINCSVPEIRELTDLHGDRIATPDSPSLWSKIGGRGGSKRALLAYLLSVVNEKLRVLKVETVLAPTSDYENLVVTARPRDLLGALWLQFSDAIERKTTFFQCNYCREWIDRKRGVRSENKFCNSRCRAKYGKSEKSNEEKELTKAAWRLRAAGSPYHEIADRMGLSENKVRHLLGDSRRQQRAIQSRGQE